MTDTPSPNDLRFHLRELDLVSAYHILLEKFWLIVITVGLFVLLGLIYIVLSPRIYEATTTLVVDQADTPVIAVTNAQPDGSSSLREQDMLKTIELELGRRSLLVRTLKRPDIKKSEYLASLANSPGSAINYDDLDRLSKHITVRLRRGSRLIDVTVEHKDPSTAQLLANNLTSEYLLEMVTRRSGISGETSQFLDDEADKMRAKLDETELSMQNLKSLMDIRNRLVDVQKDIGDLNKRYLPKHPKLIAAWNLQKDLRIQFITEMLRRNIDPIEFAPGVNVEIAMADTNKLDREMARQEGRYNVMQRDLNSGRTVYEAVLQRRKEGDVIGGSGQVGIHIVEPAPYPIIPAKPRKALVLFLCVVGGSLTGVLLAFWLNCLDSSLKTVDEAEAYLRIPLLGAIPDRISTTQQKLIFEAPFGDTGIEHVIEDKIRESIPFAQRCLKRSRELGDKIISRWRKDKNGKAATPARSRPRSRSRSHSHPKVEESHPLIMTEDPSSLLAEAFRSMRAALKLLGSKEQRKIFLFTSAVPSEGKSFTSANFAVSLAQEDVRVLLVEVDLRKPNLHRFFKVQTPCAGVAEYLTGQVPLSGCIRPSGIPNLDLLLAGGIAPNPAELLSTDGFPKLIENVARQYDRIVIDSAPILAVSDTLLISSVAQTLCLVVRAGSTPREAVNRAIRLLRNHHAILTGFVMNRLPLRTGFGASPYYYYYQAGEKYGEAYGSSRQS